MIPRLKEQYDKKIVSDLQKEFSLKNKLMVPKIIKVVLNMGLGADGNDKKKLQNCVEDISLISGQKPLITKTRKSVASFKIRDGVPIGCKTTLRKNRMYDFIQRLLGVAIPRERDFRGLDVKSFDGKGNFSLGIKEHIIFPEIDYDKIDKIRGMDISITTSAKTDQEGIMLLKAMKFPFKE